VGKIVSLRDFSTSPLLFLFFFTPFLYFIFFLVEGDFAERFKSNFFFNLFVFESSDESLYSSLMLTDPLSFFAVLKVEDFLSDWDLTPWLLALNKA